MIFTKENFNLYYLGSENLDVKMFEHMCEEWLYSGQFADYLCWPYDALTSYHTNSLTTKEEKDWMKENPGQILVVYYGLHAAFEARYTKSGFRYRITNH